MKRRGFFSKLLGAAVAAPVALEALKAEAKPAANLRPDSSVAVPFRDDGNRFWSLIDRPTNMVLTDDHGVDHPWDCAPDDLAIGDGQSDGGITIFTDSDSRIEFSEAGSRYTSGEARLVMRDSKTGEVVYDSFRDS